MNETIAKKIQNLSQRTGYKFFAYQKKNSDIKDGLGKLSDSMDLGP
jgi:hypothetical protein